jgi:multidrug efflux pump subunit AcrA (membrane-fusion protein)
MIPKRTFAAFTLLAILVLAVTSCSENPSSNRRPTPTPVPTLVKYEPATFKVARGSLLSDKTISGEIVPSKQDILFFRTAGMVSRLVVKSGDTVKKGDLLAELQVDDLLNQLQQAQIDMEVALAALDKSKNDHEYAAQKAQIDVNTAKARMDLAYLDVKNTADPDTDAKVLAHDRATINFTIAQQAYKAAQLALQQIQGTTSQKEEQAVERQKLVVQRLQALLSDRQIVAPYDGVILRVLFQAGGNVVAFNPAIEIGDPGDLVVRAKEDAKLVPSMDANTEVKLAFSSQPDVFHAIKYLPDFIPFNSSGNDRQTVFAQDYFYFTAPGDVSKSSLKLGATVSLTVVIGKRENVLLLPPAAIRNYRGLNFVIVQDGDKRRRVEISKVGLQTDANWEIEADLQPGDIVIGQ